VRLDLQELNVQHGKKTAAVTCHRRDLCFVADVDARGEIVIAREVGHLLRRAIQNCDCFGSGKKRTEIIAFRDGKKVSCRAAKTPNLAGPREKKQRDDRDQQQTG